MRFLHTNKVSVWLSPRAEERDDYTYGLMFFTIFMGTIFFCWALLLLILKCRGDEFGCASGKVIETHPDKAQWAGNASTESEGMESASSMESNPPPGRTVDASTLTRSSVFPEENLGAIQKRARRVRIAFMVSAFSALACIALLLVLAFARSKDSIEATEEIVVSTQDILDQVKSKLRTIESSAEHFNSSKILNNPNFTEFCPNATQDGVILGVDLKSFSEQASQYFDQLNEVVSENITDINATVERVQKLKDQVEAGIDQTQTYLWTVPIVLLIVAAAVTIAMLGVVLAWRRKSGQRFHCFMSYGTLPFLVALCVVCWVCTMAAAVGAITSGDACVSNGGGPDETIAEILDLYYSDQNSTAYQMIYAYTNACAIQNPTQDLVDLEDQLQTTVNSIWREISIVDSVGRDQLAAACGSSLDEFLDETRQLAKSLSTIRKAVDSTIDTLDCKVINPIYVKAVHVEICGETATGLGIAFILLLILSICLMVMVTLRTSWLHQIENEDESNVYHDDEVADNMILDEHEEYLAYISKYKHEWEDYEGFKAENMDDEGDHEDDDADEEDESGESLQSDLQKFMPVSTEEDIYVESSGKEVIIAPVKTEEEASECESSVAESTLPDDISFPSLQLTPSIAGAAVAVVTTVPSLLPATSDENDEPEFGALEVVHKEKDAASLSSNRNDKIAFPTTILTGSRAEDVDTRTNTLELANGDHLMVVQSLAKGGDGDLFGLEDTVAVEDIELSLFVDDAQQSNSEDSIVDRIMTSYDCRSASTGGDTDIMEMHYGVKLRTKSSIESELARRYDSPVQELRGDAEERDPPPPSAPPDGLGPKVESWASSGNEEDVEVVIKPADMKNPQSSHIKSPRMRKMIEFFEL
jgi:hypothetical protein